MEIVLAVTNDGYPIGIDMEVEMYWITENLTTPPTMKMKRPKDHSPRAVKTYMKVEDPLRARIRFLVIPGRIYRVMIGNAWKLQGIREMSLENHIH